MPCTAKHSGTTSVTWNVSGFILMAMDKSRNLEIFVCACSREWSFISVFLVDIFVKWSYYVTFPQM